MGKECMAQLSRHLWGGTSLKTAAKKAREGGDPRKGKLQENPHTLSLVKLQACAMAHTSPLQDYH